MSTAATVSRYRAIGERELNDLLRLGDYGLSGSESGKYFAFTERGVRTFAAHPFNRDRRMTITAIVVPRSFLDRGYILDDSGGAGPAIHFSDRVLLDLYTAMGLPAIIDASWVPTLGRGGVT